MLEINGAKIYCNVFWDDHPDRTPIVLIHASTNVSTLIAILESTGLAN